ncbi:MAG: hypothetical protein NTV86_12325 [Planctomycetota bacterium]|nr:hypothetical protein [Planctomycetota bacterium]
MVRFSAFRGTFFPPSEQPSPPEMATWERRQGLENGSFFAANGNLSGREDRREIGEEKTLPARGHREAVLNILQKEKHAPVNPGSNISLGTSG